MATLSSATHAPPAKRSKADGRDNEAGGAGGDVPWLLLPGNLPRIGRFAATVTADAGGVAARVALLDGAEELHSLSDLLAMVTQNEVKIEPPQTANYLDSVAALADSSLNVFRRPLMQFILKLSQDTDNALIFALQLHLYLDHCATLIHADYDLWNVMEHMIPCGTVQPLPPRPVSIAAEVRAAQLEGRTPQLDPRLLHSNVPPKLLSDPSRWFTVDGLLKMVENSGYRDHPQPPGLTVELRPYQRQTLAWMIDRERMPGGLNSCFWQRRDVLDEEGNHVHTYYYCPLAGELLSTPPPTNPGGFICEEMGLGKTVEALALILAQRPPPYAARRATLVVVPPTLLDQWQTEVAQRVEQCLLSTYVYTSHHPPPLSPDKYGYMACTAAIGRRKMHLSARIVAPEGVAFFSAPPYSNDYYFHTCDAEGNCSESTADIVALGVLGAGCEVVIVDMKTFADEVQWGRLESVPFFDGGTCAVPDTEKQIGWIMIKDSDKIYVDVAPSVKPVQWKPIAVTPSILSAFDLVLTCYDDVSSAASSSKKRGHAAAEARMLKKVEWLRVILDESQCLHNSRSVVTQTASELTRTYSWLLSGTPAANAVHDLVGQLVFLGVEPWCRLGPRVHSFWDNEIEARWNKQDPDILDTVHTLLAHIMMRHSKTQTVNGQPILELPPRRVETQWVRFEHPSEVHVYSLLARTLREQVERHLHGSPGHLKLGDLHVMLQCLMAFCSHPSAMSLPRWHQILSHTTDRLRRDKLVDHLSSITQHSEVQIEAMLSMAHWNPMLVLKSCGFSPEEIQTQLQALKDEHDLSVLSATASCIVQNLPAFCAANQSNEATLQMLDHLVHDNCLARADNVRCCATCRTGLHCAICQGVAVEPSLTWCLHIFCTPCINKYLKATSTSTAHRSYRGKCPLCQRPVGDDNLTRILPEAIAVGAAADGADNVTPPTAEKLATVGHLDAVTQLVNISHAPGSFPLADTQALTGEDAPDNVVANLLEFSAGKPLRTLQPSEAYVSGTARMPVNSIQSRTFVGQAVFTCSSRLYDDGATVRFDPRLPGIDKTFLAHFDLTADMLGTKALAGAERIRAWRVADPTCKIVVFASKMELLDKFCAALIFNALQPGESYAKVSPWQPRRQRNQTLKRFREDPNCICLMLQTKHYHAGLTLTMADKLLLLDLAPTAAMEKQLISRIHRIGQTRPVTVVRLVMEGTIEQQMHLRRWRDAVDPMNVGAKPPLRDDAPIDPMDLRWDDDDDDVESETTEPQQPLRKKAEREIMAELKVSAEEMLDMLKAASTSDAAMSIDEAQDYTDYYV